MREEVVWSVPAQKVLCYTRLDLASAKAESGGTHSSNAFKEHVCETRSSHSFIKLVHQTSL